jgi:hypothetical protein
MNIIEKLQNINALRGQTILKAFGQKEDFEKSHKYLRKESDGNSNWEHIFQKPYNGGFEYDYIKVQNGYGTYNLSVKKDYFEFLKKQDVIKNK